MSDRLRGILPPVTVPFDHEGHVELDLYAKNIDYYNTFNLSGAVVLGSNGEGPLLSDEESLTLVRQTRKRLSRSKVVIVGAAREATDHTLDFVARVADQGGDYALVAAPGYYKRSMTEEVLYAHYARVADSSPIPLLIYHVPQCTGLRMSAASIVRLSTHDNIAGVKESSGDLALQAEILQSAPPSFSVLVGSAPTLLPSLIQGAAGGIVAIACVLPALTLELFEAFSAGQWDKAVSIQRLIGPAAVAVTTRFGVGGLKAALDIVGLAGGVPRLPLPPLAAPERAAMRSILERTGALEPA